MYKFLSTIVFMSLISNFNSQIQKGNVSLDGSFNFSTASSNASSNYTIGSSKQYSFTFNPIAQKFIKDDLSVGVGLTLRTQNKETKITNLDATPSSNSISNSTNFGIGFNTSKYYSLSDKLYFTLNGFVGIEHGVTKNSSTYSSNTVGLILGPGFDYVFNQSFALSSSIALLQLARTRENDTEYNYKTTTNNFQISLNQASFFIGIKYFFKPQKMNTDVEPVTN